MWSEFFLGQRRRFREVRLLMSQSIRHVLETAQLVSRSQWKSIAEGQVYSAVLHGANHFRVHE